MAESIQLVYMGANAPRCDMVRDPDTGLWLPGMRLEPEAIQLCRYSRAHNSWTPVRCTVPTTNATAPDNSATADIIKEDNTPASTHLTITASTGNLTDGVTYCFSTLVAPINRTQICLNGAGGAGAYNLIYDTSDNSFPFVGGSIVSYGYIDNYYQSFDRVWYTFVKSGTGVVNIYLFVAVSGSTSFDGLNSNSITIWGTQLEAGLFPSSQIINDGVGSVTRTTDADAIWTIAGGSQEYTLLVPFCVHTHTPASDLTLLQLYTNGAVATDHITLAVEGSTGKLKVTSAATGGSAGSAIPNRVISDGKIHWLAVSIRDGRLVAWTDTNQYVATDTTVNLPAIDRVAIKPSGGWVGGIQLIRESVTRFPRNLQIQIQAAA